MNLPPPDLPPPSPAPEPPPQPVASVKESTLVTPPAVPQEEKEPTVAPESIAGMLIDAATFPWLPRNLSILIPGAIMLLLLMVASLAPLIGIIPGILGPLYFAAYYFKIVETSITKREELPDWPEVTNFFDDLVVPGFQLFGVWCIGLLPALIWGLVTGARIADAVQDPPVILGLLASLYFPIGVLAVVIRGSVAAAVHPQILLTMVKCMPHYLLLVVGLVMALLPLHFVIGSGLGGMFLGTLLSGFASMAGLVMHARLTGTYYLYHQAKFGW